MGLFDDLPNAKTTTGLFDDLPDVSETVPTPSAPPAPVADLPSLASVMVPPVDVQAMPTPAMPPEVTGQVSPLFSDIETASPYAAGVSFDPNAAVKGLAQMAAEGQGAVGFIPGPGAAGLMGEPEMPQDNLETGTLGGDLRAGLLQMQQAIPGARAGYDISQIKTQREAEKANTALNAELLAQADELEAMLPGIHDPAEYAKIEDQIIERRARAGLSDPSVNQGRIERSIADLVEQSVEIGRLNKEISEIPVNDAARRLMEAETFGEGISAAFSDPAGVARTLGARTALTSAPSIVGAVLGQALGGPVGAAGLAGLAGGGTEATLSVAEGITRDLQEAGIDPTDDASVQAFIADNPEAFGGVIERALIRAGVISAADAATAGIVGGVVRAARNMGRGVRATTAAGTGTVVEPLGEGAGEALAGVATGEGVSPPDVLAEMIGGGVIGGPTAVGQSISEGFRASPKAMEEPKEGGSNVNAPPIPQTSVETLGPVRPGDETGSQGSEVDPEIRGRGTPERPEGGNVEQDLPRVDTGSERNGNLTAAQPTEPQEDLNAAQPAPTEPTPADEAPAPRPERRATIYTPENDPVEVEYQVVEADEVLTSDQEGFDQSAQPRDRKGNKNSEIQIEGIANKPTFARLNRAPETDRGAPVVGADGLVESGNGRTIGLRRAYERGTADEYRAQLEAEYPEAAGMKKPIVIARRLSDVNRDDFAYQSNKPATQALSAVEEARAEARMVDRDVLDLYRGGPIMAASNRDMVRALIKKMPATDQNRMLNSEGGLTADGQRRVQAAIFSRAYDDPALLDRMASSVDDDMKNVTSVLTDLAPRVAKMRDAMERGEVAAEGDFIPALTEAIGQIANMRSRGETLSDFKAQIDAFAEPLSETTQTIMDAMFNEAGTRMASKKDMADFIGFAIDAAEAQDATTETLPGIEPVPPKPASEIVKDARRKTQDAPPDQGALLESADGAGRRPRKSGPKKQQRADDQGRTEDAGDQGSVAEAVAVRKNDGRTPRPPQGKLSPGFLKFSFNERSSVYQSAMEDAGVDPTEARLMDVDEQISIISDMIEDRFGVTVELPKITVRKKNKFGRKVEVERTSISNRKALDQLLDAYQNLQMLAGVMGIPEKAIGLPIDGKGITLSLVSQSKLRGALGMFSWGGGKRTISLAERSNSFAHEWGHALDHYLNQLADKALFKGMLTRNMQKQGMIPPLSPKRMVTDAFAHVLWSIFGDSSQLAALKLRLQVESAQLGPDGKPTPKAKTAQNLLTKMREGKRPPQELLSDYFKTSKQYDEMMGGTGYFTDPAEMFARAFEAWVGVSVSSITDLPQSFLSKGGWAYEDMNDTRLALTFPKDGDRVQFALAMSNLSRALNAVNQFGTGPKGQVPATANVSNNNDLLNYRIPESLAAREKEDLKATYSKIRNALRASTAKEAITAGAKGLRQIYQTMINTMGAMLYAVADRQKSPKAKEAFTNISKMIAKRPGSGNLQQNIYQETVERVASRYLNKVSGAVKKHLPKGKLSNENAVALRRLLNGQKVAAPAAVKNLAADLRGVLNDVWYDLQQAGIPVSYAKDYLPHIFDVEAVDKNRAGFEKQAAKVYSILFDNEITNSEDAEGRIADLNAVIKGLENAQASTVQGEKINESRISAPLEALIGDWRKAMQVVKDAKKKLKAAQKRKTKVEEATQAAQEALAEAQEAYLAAEGDLIPSLRDAFAEHAADKWFNAIGVGQMNDFQSVGPTSSFLKGRTLPKETGHIMEDYMMSNPIDLIQGYIFAATRKAEYAKMVGPDGEKLEAMLRAARDAGATEEDIRLVKTSFQTATGRLDNTNLRGAQRFFNWAFVVGQLRLLPNAAWSSLSESSVIGLRSGEVSDSLRSFIDFVTLLGRRGKRAELIELAQHIGTIRPYALDTLMENRMSADALSLTPVQQSLVTNFHIKTGLVPLTQWQRITTSPTAHAIIMRHLRNAVRGERGALISTRRHDAIAGGKGKFSDRELNELGIAESDRADLLDWLEGIDGMPKPENLYGPDGDMHEAAELYARAMYRLTHEAVTNPLKTDRTLAANHPLLAAMYGIMSFNDGFTRNMIIRNAVRGINPEDSNLTKTGKIAANVSMSVHTWGVIFAGHILFTVIREYLTNGDKWEEKDEKDELMDWLLDRAFFRTGITGRLDPLAQAYTGVKWDRDLTALTAGPYIGSTLQELQTIMEAFAGRNSPDTNTTEFNAARALYRLAIQPAANALISAYAPAGPIGVNASRGMIMGASRYDTANAFAEWIVGPKGTKYKGDPPWLEFGD